MSELRRGPMAHGPARRAGVGGLAIGVVVTGFDPAARQWLSGSAGRGGVSVPPLTGRLLFDEADLAAASDDFGHIVHRRPRAVLQPGSVDDVAVMVRFCYDLRIPVAARGQGHSTYGQAQVAGGLVIEMGTLDAIAVDAPPATPPARPPLRPLRPPLPPPRPTS